MDDLHYVNEFVRKVNTYVENSIKEKSVLFSVPENSTLFLYCKKEVIHQSIYPFLKCGLSAILQGNRVYLVNIPADCYRDFLILRS